jgi:hypothetical protein
MMKELRMDGLRVDVDTATVRFDVDTSLDVALSPRERAAAAAESRARARGHEAVAVLEWPELSIGCDVLAALVRFKATGDPRLDGLRLALGRALVDVDVIWISDVGHMVDVIL